MLSSAEKKEMLADAACPKRREAFRATHVIQRPPSMDAYLKFLTDLDKVFDRISASAVKSAGANYKL